MAGTWLHGTVFLFLFLLFCQKGSALCGVLVFECMKEIQRVDLLK